MNRTTGWLIAGTALVAGYFAFKWWKNTQRAAAHPITIRSDASILKPMRVDPSLVSDAKIMS